MARVKIDLPETFNFKTSFPVRITDLNYGNHVGNDKVLGFIHEARVRWLVSLSYSELNMEGVGMIMADATLQFKSEIFYGDELEVSLQPVEFSRIGFDLVYKIEKKSSKNTELAALAHTSMICYDYSLKKVTSLPEAAKTRMTNVS